MIKALLATATAMLLASPGAAAPKDWSKVVTATDDGGYVMGNPKASASLVEYGSFTCPHCKAFHDEGMPAIRAKYIAPGTLRFEFRSFARNGPDIAAGLLARCGGLPLYYRAVDRFYDRQDQWIAPFTTMTDEQAKMLDSLTPEKQILPLARLGKLDTVLQPLGITPAKATKCLSDETAVKAATADNKKAIDGFGLTGTPWFVLNGKPLADTFTWEQLEPQLAAAFPAAAALTRPVPKGIVTPTKFHAKGH